MKLTQCLIGKAAAKVIYLFLFLTICLRFSDADDVHAESFKQCRANDTACRSEKNKIDNLRPEELDRLCYECRLTGRSIDDLTRRPRQADLTHGTSKLDQTHRIDLDKIKKLVCRDYMKDDEREKCRDFYYSNLPTIIDWKESKPEVSFQDYICIQKLKYCCPQNSFGQRCKKCPMCNTNEQCHGEGSRSGNGTCVCKDGHSGPNCISCLPGYYSPGEKKILIKTAEDVGPSKANLQDNNRYEHYANETICKKCHKSCQYCRAGGPDGCEVCRQGYSFIPNDGCSDIDECVKERGICGLNTFCVNTEGSYFCYGKYSN